MTGSDAAVTVGDDPQRGDSANSVYVSGQASSAGETNGVGVDEGSQSSGNAASVSDGPETASNAEYGGVGGETQSPDTASSGITAEAPPTDEASSSATSPGEGEGVFAYPTDSPSVSAEGSGGGGEEESVAPAGSSSSTGERSASDPVSAIFDLLKLKWLAFVTAVSGVVGAMQFYPTTTPSPQAWNASSFLAFGFSFWLEKKPTTMWYWK